MTCTLERRSHRPSLSGTHQLRGDSALCPVDAAAYKLDLIEHPPDVLPAVTSLHVHAGTESGLAGAKMNAVLTKTLYVARHLARPDEGGGGGGGYIPPVDPVAPSAVHVSHEPGWSRLSASARNALNVYCPTARRQRPLSRRRRARA